MLPVAPTSEGLTPPSVNVRISFFICCLKNLRDAYRWEFLQRPRYQPLAFAAGLECGVHFYVQQSQLIR